MSGSRIAHSSGSKIGGSSSGSNTVDLADPTEVLILDTPHHDKPDKTELLYVGDDAHDRDDDNTAVLSTSHASVGKPHAPPPQPSATPTWSAAPPSRARSETGPLGHFARLPPSGGMSTTPTPVPPGGRWSFPGALGPGGAALIVHTPPSGSGSADPTANQISNAESGGPMQRPRQARQSSPAAFAPTSSTTVGNTSSASTSSASTSSASANLATTGNSSTSSSSSSASSSEPTASPPEFAPSPGLTQPPRGSTNRRPIPPPRNPSSTHSGNAASSSASTHSGNASPSSSATHSGNASGPSTHSGNASGPSAQSGNASSRGSSTSSGNASSSSTQSGNPSPSSSSTQSSNPSSSGSSAQSSNPSSSGSSAQSGNPSSSGSSAQSGNPSSSGSTDTSGSSAPSNATSATEPPEFAVLPSTSSGANANANANSDAMIADRKKNNPLPPPPSKPLSGPYRSVEPLSTQLHVERNGEFALATKNELDTIRLARQQAHRDADELSCRLDLIDRRVRQAYYVRKTRDSFGGAKRKEVLSVFTAPEWSFKIPGKPLTSKQRDQIVAHYTKLSKGMPGMLIIPGTIVSTPKGRPDQIQAEALVFHDGKQIKQTHKAIEGLDVVGQRHKHGKYTSDDYKGLTANNDATRPAFGEDSSIFEFEGLYFSLEICADHGASRARTDATRQGHGVDVQIIVSDGVHAKYDTLAAHSGGVVIQNDAVPNLDHYTEDGFVESPGSRRDVRRPDHYFHDDHTYESRETIGQLQASAPLEIRRG